MDNPSTCELGLFDVDGTITESAQPIRMSMALALRQAKQRLGFISGTGLAELRRMLDPLLMMRPDCLLLPEMGISCHVGVTEIYDCGKRFPTSLFNEVVKVAQKSLADIGVIPLADDVFQIRRSQMTISIVGRTAPIQVKKDVDPTGTIRRKVILDIDKHIKQMRLPEEEKLCYTLGGTSSIDIQQGDWDKYDGVMRIARHLGIEPCQINFYGDRMQPGGNDWPVKATGAYCVEVKSPEHLYYMLRKHMR